MHYRSFSTSLRLLLLWGRGDAEMDSCSLEKVSTLSPSSDFQLPTGRFWTSSSPSSGLVSAPLFLLSLPLADIYKPSHPFCLLSIHLLPSDIFPLFFLDYLVSVKNNKQNSIKILSSSILLLKELPSHLSLGEFIFPEGLVIERLHLKSNGDCRLLSLKAKVQV